MGGDNLSGLEKITSKKQLKIWDDGNLVCCECGKKLEVGDYVDTFYPYFNSSICKKCIDKYSERR